MDYTFLKEKQAKDLRSSRIKLIALLVILVLVVAAIIRYPSRGQVNTKEEPVSQKATTALKATTEQGKEPIDIRGKGETEVPAIPQASVLEQIQDRHSDLEPAPFFYMLHLVAQDKPDGLKAQAKKGIDWNVFWDKPETLRGEPVEIRGTLIRSWHQTLGKNPLTWNGKPVAEVWGYRLRAEGAPRESHGYFFDVYSIEKLHGAIQDDHLVAYGRFLKARTLEASTYKEADLNAAVAVVPRFEPLTYLDDPKPPAPIVQDGPVELRALYYLLKRVMAIPFQQLKASAATQLTQVDFVSHPEDYFGKPVALRGQLLRCQRMGLDENPLRLDSIYRGYIVDIDHGINTFYCLNIPEGLRLKDEVRLYGLFLKKWTYTNERGQETTSPVFVAQAIVQVEIAQDRTLHVVLAAMIGIIAVLLVIAHFRNRRQVRAEAEARRQRDLAHVPQNLNEVARRVLAEAHGEDPAPKAPDKPTQPPEPEKKP